MKYTTTYRTMLMIDKTKKTGTFIHDNLKEGGSRVVKGDGRVGGSV